MKTEVQAVSKLSMVCNDIQKSSTKVTSANVPKPYSEVIGTSGNNIRVMGTCSDSSDSLSMTHQYMERNTQLTNVP